MASERQWKRAEDAFLQMVEVSSRGVIRNLRGGLTAAMNALKTTSKTAGVQPFAWPLPEGGNIWAMPDDFIEHHWHNIIMHCLLEIDTSSAMGLRYEAQPVVKPGVIGCFRVVGSDTSKDMVLTLSYPTRQDQLSIIKDFIDHIHTVTLERLAAEAKYERRQKAIASLTQEQREALGL